jgi:hypothetical protein
MQRSVLAMKGAGILISVVMLLVVWGGPIIAIDPKSGKGKHYIRLKENRKLVADPETGSLGIVKRVPSGKSNRVIIVEPDGNASQRGNNEGRGK